MNTNYNLPDPEPINEPVNEIFPGPAIELPPAEFVPLVCTSVSAEDAPAAIAWLESLGESEE